MKNRREIEMLVLLCLPRNVGLAGEVAVEGFEAWIGVEIWEGHGHVETLRLDCGSGREGLQQREGFRWSIIGIYNMNE